MKYMKYVSLWGGGYVSIKRMWFCNLCIWQPSFAAAMLLHSKNTCMFLFGRVHLVSVNFYHKVSYGYMINCNATGIVLN